MKKDREQGAMLDFSPGGYACQEPCLPRATCRQAGGACVCDRAFAVVGQSCSDPTW